jgi:ArsR family transcriptional regulator, lead/cadmium/zinc/bismuth-responsive transcriptional repressor
MNDDTCDLLCLDLPRAERLRAERLPDAATDAAASRASALSDPTRLMLAVTLSKSDELCVCDLAWVAERSQNLVSHHLRRLRSDGLVSSRRDGKMVMYSMTPTGAALVAAVVADPESVAVG